MVKDLCCVWPALCWEPKECHKYGQCQHHDRAGIRHVLHELAGGWLSAFDAPYAPFVPCRWPHSRDVGPGGSDGQAALFPTVLCCQPDRCHGRTESSDSRAGLCQQQLKRNLGAMQACAGALQLCRPDATRGPCLQGEAAKVARIPRSREVGQSYLTSIWTTLVAIWAALAMVWREKPQLVRAVLHSRLQAPADPPGCFTGMPMHAGAGQWSGDLYTNMCGSISLQVRSQLCASQSEQVYTNGLGTCIMSM